MGIFPWYKHDPKAWLVATRNMPIELRGAYITILDLIYIHDGKLRDRPKEICQWLGVGPKRWSRLRTELLERGKLFVIDGHLHNERADREMRRAIRERHRFSKNMKNGRGTERVR